MDPSVQFKKRRRSGLRWGFLNCAIGFVDKWMIQLFRKRCTRACLKNHFRNLQAPLCGRFYPHSVAVARYAALIRIKSPTNWDSQLTKSLFQTRSSYVNRFADTFAVFLPIIIATQKLCFCQVKRRIARIVLQFALLSWVIPHFVPFASTIPPFPS